MCDDPSWVLPAHDRGNQVVKGGHPYVDLVAAAKAAFKEWRRVLPLERAVAGLRLIENREVFGKVVVCP